MKRRSPSTDQGAILPLVAICMTVLLGMGAMVIDVGQLYAERRQLQNGADAAALAVAQSCAGPLGCGDYGSMAANLANLSARDGLSTVREICFGGPQAAQAGVPLCGGTPPAGATGALGWVKVTTRTLTPQGDEVDFLLAPIITTLTGKTVEATAIAAWGVTTRGFALPFVVPECKFEELGGDVASGTIPTGTVYIFSEYTTGNGRGGNQQNECTVDRNGNQLPGNFGWIDGTGDCLVDLSIDDTATGDPGNDSPLNRYCSDEEIISLIQNQVVLLAIYDTYAEQGNNASYELVTFIGFRVTGFKLSGQVWPSGFTCPTEPGQNEGDLRCFRGEITEVVLDGDFGDSGNYYGTGVTSVKMIG